LYRSNINFRGRQLQLTIQLPFEEPISLDVGQIEVEADGAALPVSKIRVLDFHSGDKDGWRELSLRRAQSTPSSLPRSQSVTPLK
jgi:hypothetical protein